MITSNPVNPYSFKFKLDKFSNTKTLGKLNKKQHHSKVQFNSFALNGHILEFCPQNQKLENFV